MPPENTDNGWDKHGEHIKAEVKRLADSYESIDRRIAALTERFIKLETEFKIKAGVWGITGGIMAAVGVLLVRLALK